jgi:hypothetical protein
MKIVKSSVLGLFLLLLMQPAAAQFNLGVMGGINRSNLSGDAPSNAVYAPRNGFAGGIFADIKIAKDVLLSFQPMYMQKGTTIAVDVRGESNPQDSLNVNLSYISLPLMVKVISGNGKTYVTGGLDVGFLQNATVKPVNSGSEQDIQDSIQQLDIAVNFGLGIMIPVGTPKLLFELRYVQGLMDISNIKTDPEGKSLPPQFKTGGFQFFTGLMIPLGKKN